MSDEGFRPYSSLIAAGREVVEVRRTRRGSYQLERIRCGKPTCRCARGGPGSGHGPYWYLYWKQDGRTRSKYIGKELRYLTPASPGPGRLGVHNAERGSPG